MSLTSFNIYQNLLFVIIFLMSTITIKVVGANPNPRTTTIPACKTTLYQDACESSLVSVAKAPSTTPTELFHLSVQFAMGRAHFARAMAYDLSLVSQKTGTQSLSGIDDCIELLDDSLGHLKDALGHSKGDKDSEDIRTWLSAALTNQETCLESLKSVESPMARDLMEAEARTLTQFTSNSLALYQPLWREKAVNKKSGGRKLLSDDGFPTWVSAGERKLLEASVGDIRAHAVVSKDGTGTHKTIGEALLFASLAGEGRSVIHVTAGTYKESLKIPSSQKNVMLVGDGKGITVIVGSKNAQDGSTTFGSATFAASGEGFIARDISFVNDAGPAKHQAVALRVGSDRSVIYRCSIEGYQDSLYTLSNRQFYKENDIYGTVDFIFGNSAAVFQSCNIYARQPGGGQKNFVTAQGRSDPNQNTGISIQNCKISGASKTYLGRPWKAYSRTVVMKSSLDGSIDPAGWYEWSGSFGLKTLFYGEYMNSGPGAGTSGRVQWPGFHPSLTAAQASEFTVSNFISGNSWLPSTGVPFS